MSALHQDTFLIKQNQKILFKEKLPLEKTFHKSQQKRKYQKICQIRKDLRFLLYFQKFLLLNPPYSKIKISFWDIFCIVTIDKYVKDT